MEPRRAHAARDYNHRVHRKRSAGNAGADVVVIEDLKLFPVVTNQPLNEIGHRHRTPFQFLVQHPEPRCRDDQLNSGHAWLGCKVVQESLGVDCAAGAGDGNGDVHAGTGTLPPSRPMLHQIHYGLTDGKQMLDKPPAESPEWARLLAKCTIPYRKNHLKQAP